MKINKVRATPLRVPLERCYWVGNQHFDAISTIVVAVETDAGIRGLSTVNAASPKAAVEALGEIGLLLAGEDPLDIEGIWKRLFSLTYTSPGTYLGRGYPAALRPEHRSALLPSVAAIDLALWDIKGKVEGRPVWQMLGGSRRQIAAYATGGYYYDDMRPGDCAEEMAGYVAKGFGAVKLKVGAADRASDVDRVRRVREAIGPGVRLMLDANCAYSSDEAARAIEQFEPFDIFWIEEPLRWHESVRSLGLLAEATKIPLASGESVFDEGACRDLVDLGGVRFMQYDATRAGGATEWLRVAAYCALLDVQMATHHAAPIQAHLAAAAPNGFCVETFPDELRDPVFAGLFSERAELSSGQIRLSDRPGFGIEFDPAFIRRYAV